MPSLPWWHSSHTGYLSLGVIGIITRGPHRPTVHSEIKERALGLSLKLQCSYVAGSLTVALIQSTFSAKVADNNGNMTFFNPEIPGLSHGNPGISGLEKWTGIPGFGIPGLQSLVVTACSVDSFKVRLDLFVGHRRYEH